MPIELPENRLVLGTSTIGIDGDRERAYRLLDTYLDLGGQVIDTANVYSDWVPGESGRSETIIGEWLASRGTRNRMAISTKGGHPPIGDIHFGRLDPASLKYDIETSLRRLRTDRVEMYFLHRDDRSRPVAEIMGTLQGFVDAGQIGAVGLSNWDVNRIEEARQVARTKPVANQLLGNVLNLAMTPPEDTTTRALDSAAFRQASKGGLALWLFTSQAQGALTKVAAGAAAPRNYANPDALHLAGRINDIAREHGIEPTVFAVAFLLAFSPNIVPIVGAKTDAQLRQSMSAGRVRLDPATVRAVAELSGFAGL